MPLTLAEAERLLRQDGRYDWLLSGRQAWSVNEVARAFGEAHGVPVSHDAVTRWFKRLPDGAAEQFGGTIGWRARRDALVVFFADREHLNKPSGAEQAG